MAKHTDTGKVGEEMEVKIGDKVLFGEFSGSEVKCNGKIYLLMRQADVQGII